VDLLARNLNGAGPLRSVPPSISTPGWNGRADGASAVALGRRTRAGTSIVGAVDRVGPDSLRLTVTLFDVAAGRLIGEHAVTLPTARMDAAADSLTVGVLATLGRERPLGSSRPPSNGPNAMAALKAYLQGEMHLRAASWDSAQIAYNRAVQLDTAYALAYHRLSFVRPLRGSGIDSLIWFNGIRAGQLARGLPERDSLVVTIDSVQAGLWYAFNAPASLGVNRDSVFAALRPRLTALIDVATRRFPDDAELWYTKAVNLTNWGSQGSARWNHTLDALNQAIRLDSGFVPPYWRTMFLSASLGGADSARRLVQAFIRHGVPGPDADAARLLDALLDSKRSRAPETERLLTAATPPMLFNAWQVLFWQDDSAQTALRVVDRLSVHPEASQLAPTGASYIGFLTARTLASRGRVREACSRAQPRLLNRWLFVQLAYLGCLPADSASAELTWKMEQARRRPSELGLYLPWWAKVGDLERLEALRRLADSAASVRGASSAAKAYAGFLRESAQAYLALARADSAAARHHFDNAPDTLCIACDAQRLDKVRLLAAAGETRRAFALTGDGIENTGQPLAILLRLERARLAERLGEQSRAINDYRRVVAAWSVGDPAMRDTAKVARDALTRLGAK
jgi:hypothetical protein